MPSLEEIANNWGKETAAQQRRSFGKLGISKGKGKRSIRHKLYYKDGDVHRVAFAFKRYLVFVEKGVGRGYPIEKAGQGDREQKPWFSPVLERRLPQLAKEVADVVGDKAVEEIDLGKGSHL